MKLNHLNLVVTNVAATVTFFETYFDFKCIAVKGEHAIAILTGVDQFTLVLMAPSDGNADYPKAFHLGFMQDTIEKVNALYEKLKSGGIVLEQEPRKIRDSFGFYFQFDTIMIEVGHYTSGEK
jgi:catechol 2,3-dioxygenase-like lactoylglutathione lyase family enzyme